MRGSVCQAGPGRGVCAGVGRARGIHRTPGSTGAGRPAGGPRLCDSGSAPVGNAPGNGALQTRAPEHHVTGVDGERPVSHGGRPELRFSGLISSRTAMAHAAVGFRPTAGVDRDEPPPRSRAGPVLSGRDPAVIALVYECAGHPVVQPRRLDWQKVGSASDDACWVAGRWLVIAAGLVT